MPADMPADPTVSRMEEIVSAHAELEGPLLPILHAIQDEFGFVPETAVPVIARLLNLSRAEVHGVVSFYHDFRHAPAGRHVLRLCRAEACKSVGADRVAAHVTKRLGIAWHETTADGAVTLEPVFCLGLCACGPSAQIDGRLVGRVDEGALDRILAEVAR